MNIEDKKEKLFSFVSRFVNEHNKKDMLLNLKPSFLYKGVVYPAHFTGAPTKKEWDYILHHMKLKGEHLYFVDKLSKETLPTYHGKNIQELFYRALNDKENEILIKNSCSDKNCINPNHLYNMNEYVFYNNIKYKVVRQSYEKLPILHNDKFPTNYVVIEKNGHYYGIYKDTGNILIISKQLGYRYNVLLKAHLSGIDNIEDINNSIIEYKCSNGLCINPDHIEITPLSDEELKGIELQKEKERELKKEKQILEREKRSKTTFKLRYGKTLNGFANEKEALASRQLCQSRKLTYATKEHAEYDLKRLKFHKKSNRRKKNLKKAGVYSCGITGKKHYHITSNLIVNNRHKHKNKNTQWKTA